MTTWIIEPREPIIVRDGRPFNRQPGVMAATLPFPFPSTTAGAARSRAGSPDGVFSAQGDLPGLKAIKVRGPLLAKRNHEENWQLLAPAPGDALLLEHDKLLRCWRLKPVEPPEDAWMEPCKNVEARALLPIGPATYDPAKPAKGQPAFWHWNVFEDWLLNPEMKKLDGGLFASADLGIQPLPQEERVHVGLERGMMVAQEGALFETRGLEFINRPGNEFHLHNAQSLALWLAVEEHPTHKIREGLDSLGGERRLVSWQANKLEIPQCPKALREQIVQDRACRLILLTPACFRNGYFPDVACLELKYESAKPNLRAALVQRPQIVSGWDVERSRPKPMRRLAPAGSIFFLEFADEAREEDLQVWIDRIWMNCISDDQQANNDGFGLAVLGTWDGQPQPMYDPRKL